LHLIGRRNFLAGLGLGAGSHLLTPIFKTLLPEALGAGTLAKRLVLFTAGNGFLERFFTCPSRSETDFDLTPVFMPLAKYKQNLVIMHKFWNHFSMASHGNQMATLTVTESPVQESQMRGPPGGISIDRLIAKRIGANDPFDSTAVGCVTFRQGGSYDKALCMSADGKGAPFPAIGSPTLAFQRWFGQGMAAPGSTSMGSGDTLDQTLSGNHQFLDLITEDIARLKQRLGGPERAKLDQYLDSLDKTSKSIQLRAAAEVNCKAVMAPKISPMAGALDENVDPAVLAAHIDVTFQALRCGLTHVSHITIEGMEAPHVRYQWVGETANHHNDHHAYNYPVLQNIVTWWFQQIGTMVDKLASAPEGNGTMLDNSVVMFIDSCGGIHHRGHDLHPIILIAGKNTGLKGGRYLQFPMGQHCISDAYVSIANLFLDPPITTFGNPTVCKGPLTGFV
jgi:hypothetical protein